MKILTIRKILINQFESKFVILVFRLKLWRATMCTLLIDVHRHKINVSVMHGNLSVGHVEEENNFSDVSEIIDVRSIIVPCRGRASEQKEKKRGIYKGTKRLDGFITSEKNQTSSNCPYKRFRIIK